MEVVAARPVEIVPTRSGGPYVGPRPFEGRDKMFFFGRERAAQELANMVAACALTVVYGPSGAGKSSLLNTKLLDELTKIESDWHSVMFNRWQPGFETALRTALDEKLERDPGETPLDGYAKMLQEAVRNTRSPVVLVFDQFEEYFLYHGTGTPWFEILLAQLANGRERGVHVVLSLRSDRLFLLDRLRRRIPHILQNLFLIDPLNAAGSADAILKPIESYNKLYDAAIGVEPVLVDAVVRGADEQQIFQRLPFRGRGKAAPRTTTNGTEAATASPDGRIVAPFLQLALAALWAEDIEECGGKMLTLATLRTLAGAPADAPADSLVGLLAQQHLDTVLFNRPAAEQAICATVFDRMVTYSGGKVAVAVPGDFSALLDPQQQQAAAALLEELSTPGPDCLVRRVATDSQQQHLAASDRIEERFEILHDALAVPILDWVTRWREEQARIQAAEREKASAAARDEQRARKRRAWRMVWIAATIVVVVVPILMAYRDRQETMARIAAFTRVDAQPQFRLRLLLGLSSLAEADGPWNLVLKKKPVRESLRNTLLRSPRYGGTYRGIGLDEAGMRLARVVNVNPGFAQIQVLTLRDDTLTVFDAPPELSSGSIAHAPQSASKKLLTQRVPEVLVGFLAGIDDPVLLSRGILYYRTREPVATWSNLDIGQYLPQGFDEAPNFPIVELTAGAVQITAMSLSGNEMLVLRLRPARAPDGTLQFTSAVPSVPVKWLGQRYQPALSAWLDEPPHERFAHLSVPDPASPGQLIAPVLTVGDLTGATAERPLWTGSAQLSADWIQGALASPGAPGPASVVFTDDGSAIAVRYGAQILVVPLKDFSQPLSFRVPASVRMVTPGGSPFMRPSIAAVRMASEAGRPALWRFALPDAAGVVIVEGDGENNDELRLYRTWTGDATTLLPGLNGVLRLRFSRDGAFLIVQQPQWPERLHQVRIWDLRTDWSGRVSRVKDDATLKQLICDLADIDPAGRTLRPDERITWIGAAAPEPCAQ